MALTPLTEYASEDDRLVDVIEHHMRGGLFAPLKLHLVGTVREWEEDIHLRWGKNDELLSAQVHCLDYTAALVSVEIVDAHGLRVPVSLDSNYATAGSDISLNVSSWWARNIKR